MTVSSWGLRVVTVGVCTFILAGCNSSPADTAEAGSGTGGGTTAEAGTATDGGTTATTGADTWNCGMHVLTALDEDCEGIGTAQQLLDQGATAQMSELEWSSFDSQDISQDPASGSTSLTVELRYDGGEARCFHYCDPCPGQPCGAAGQEARIEVDGFVDASTVDGALAESWEVVASRVGSGPQTAYAGSTTPASIQGTLTVELLNSDFQDLEVGISGLFADGFTSGSLNAFASHPDPTGPSITVPIASWPMP